MASSVLGKRTRSSIDTASSSVTSRAKRQATTSIFSDEYHDPFDLRQTCAGTQNVNSMDLDELAEAESITTTPAKKAAKRITLSPASIKIHFNTVKPRNDENREPLQSRTPRTPRHRDALSKKIPITPRHRVTATGKIFTPRTPRTPSSIGCSTSTVYNAARQLFARSSDPGRLIGREDERKELKDFIDSCISRTSGGCVYVSGPPGTGKSALVREVATEIQSDGMVRKVYVNCMSMNSSNDIYATLLGALCEENEIFKDDAVRTLQGMFAPRKRLSTVYMVTLDEIDHVLTLDLEILYKLFEWSLQKSSRLVLIGIANALDLTDRFLPLLKTRNLKPHLLPILPYNSSQIREIITSRLKSLVPTNSADKNFVPFLHPAAIELCSRKVSSQSGDLRKAFDICRRAIELIESETKEKYQQALDESMNSPSKKPLGENVNLSSPLIPPPCTISQQKTLAQPLSGLTVDTAPRAGISHVNKITSSTLGNGANQRLKVLNLQQKAALCALVALERRKRLMTSNIMATPSKSRTAAPTIKALYNTYSMLCKRDSILHPLTSIEFRDVIGSLETLSLISAVDGKTGSFVGYSTPSKRGRKPGFGGGVGTGDEKSVGSCVSENELEQALEGPGASILKSILSGEGLD